MTAEQAKEKIKSEVMRHFVEEFKASGDAERAARLLSASYLLFTEANHYAEAAVELMTRHHIVRKKVKTTANNLMQSFDSFDKEMRSMIPNAQFANALCNDTDTLTDILDTYIDSHIEVVRGPYFQPKLFLPIKNK